MTLNDEVQRFSATSGRFFGVLAVATAVGLVVLLLLDSDGDPSYAAIALLVFLGALAWAALLRPRIEVGRSELVLRNMLTTATVPLAAIESVAVRQVLVVFAGDRRFTSPAVGRSRRQLHRDERGGRSMGSHGGMMGITPAMPSAPEQPDTARTSYGLFVEERIRSRVADALAVEGIKARSADQARFADDIRRQPALPEIVVLAGSFVASVLLVVL